MATVEVVSAQTALPVEKSHESVKIDHLEVAKKEDVVESWSPLTPDNVVQEKEMPEKEETTDDHDEVARVTETRADEVNENVVVEEAAKDVVVINFEVPKVVTDITETKDYYNKVAPDQQPEPVVLDHDETKTTNSDEPPKEAEAEHVESAVEVPKEEVVEEEEKFVEAESNVETDAPTEKNE